MKTDIPKYMWDEDRGVVQMPEDRQVMQLLWSGNWNFRSRCGRLLVDALNASQTVTLKKKVAKRATRSKD